MSCERVAWFFGCDWRVLTCACAGWSPVCRAAGPSSHPSQPPDRHHLSSRPWTDTPPSGATRPRLTSPLSEGASYHRLAAAKGLLPNEPDSSTVLPASMRAHTEEYALDSYENLVFSLARFREVTGHWPEKVTVVGYGMKRSR